MRKFYLFLLLISVTLIPERLSLVEIGHFWNNVNYQKVKVVGKYGYLTAGKRGVIIVDLTEPSSPKELSKIETMDYTYSIDIQGLKLYVADGKGGVRIFDIRDKKNPKPIGFIGTNYSSLDIEVSGNYGYVAEGKGGLRILNLSESSFPEEIANWNDSNYIKSLKIVNGYAYLAARKGILVLDITNPDSLPEPKWIKTIDSVNNIWSDGRWLFASGGEKDFIVADIADCRYPIIQRKPGGYREVNDIHLSGYHLYLAQGNFGLRILNILVPFNPITVSRTILPYNISGICVRGNLLYVTSRYDGLKIYRIREE
ncbi:MAG: hypothetical protein U9N06_00245 [candidate division WOR-3 bacterium]|nr:hypothetical protein [candidate division WOR-3 bacterium]